MSVCEREKGSSLVRMADNYRDQIDCGSISICLFLGVLFGLVMMVVRVSGWWPTSSVRPVRREIDACGS